MKHFITLLFLMVSTLSFSQNDLDSLLKVDKFEKVEYYGDNGINVRELINLDLFGRRHGICYSFNADGTLWGVARFKHGKKHGSWLIYYNNGTIAGEYEYHKGKRVGDWKLFNSDGDLIATRSY